MAAGEDLNKDLGVEDSVLKEHIERYKFAFKFIQNKKVLDIACGTGYGSKMMVENGAREVVGADVSATAISEANKLRFGRSNLSFKQSNATKLLFQDDSFETVVSFETIEHIENYQKFIQEIKRVLKPGGILVLSTPNQTATKQLLINNPFHIKEFNLGQFKALISSDFESVKFFGQRKINKLSFEQKIIRLAYQIYSKIKFLHFLSRLIPAKKKHKLGQGMTGANDDYQINGLEPGQMYLYLIAVANNKK